MEMFELQNQVSPFHYHKLINEQDGFGYKDNQGITILDDYGLGQSKHKPDYTSISSKEPYNKNLPSLSAMLEKEANNKKKKKAKKPKVKTSIFLSTDPDYVKSHKKKSFFQKKYKNHDYWFQKSDID